MRGGTSKGVFFLADDLPSDAAARDRILMRVVGSPDRYGKQIDGMGGATSSTTKVVVISKSAREDCDVDYWFGAVAIDRPVIDWSANCGNLTSAVGPFAITEGLLEAPADGLATVRIWQANVGQRIIARVPMRQGEVLEDGDFELDGVAFPAAEISIEFEAPDADDAGPMFPTGNQVDMLDVPGVGRFEVTLIEAGIPMIFLEAQALGLVGTEMQQDVNGDTGLLDRVERIRAEGALAMGLVKSAEEATRTRPHSPKLAFVSRPADYTASDGKRIEAQGINVVARTFSMGPLHHAMTGTGAVAIATAAAIPGTIVHRVTRHDGDGRVRFGHPSGALTVGAEVHMADGRWTADRVMMSRSARRLMEGWVRVPADCATSEPA